MSANTPTPRKVKTLFMRMGTEVVALKDYRKLEQELSASVAECARLKAELEQMREDAKQAGWERDLAE